MGWADPNPTDPRPGACGAWSGGSIGPSWLDGAASGRQPPHYATVITTFYVSNDPARKEMLDVVVSNRAKRHPCKPPCSSRQSRRYRLRRLCETYQIQHLISDTPNTCAHFAA